MFSRISNYFKRLFRLSIKGEFLVKEVGEIDQQKLYEGLILIEHRGGKDRWLHFLCPCSCGDKISISLMQSSDPHWSLIKNNDRTITISPSISKFTSCKSHFFIKNSRIIWA